MAALELSEIKPGLVAWLDQGMLKADERVVETYPQDATQPRPFVCYEAPGVGSSWAPLTTHCRPERLSIPLEWRTGGGIIWRSGQIYLCDGANTCAGPHAAFLDASHNELSLTGSRATLTPEGLEGVRSEIAAQVARRQMPGANK